MSFKHRPVPIPSEDSSHEEIMGWIQSASAEEIIPMGHEEAHEFVQRCMDAGYSPDEHGFLRHWLTDKVGQLLAQTGE